MDVEIQVKTVGGPEGLAVVEGTARDPGPGEIRLRQKAVGVGFIDIYHRTGLYPLPEPRIPGVEGAGVVEAVGPGVEGVNIGDRVVYAGMPGGYASTRLLPAWRAVPLPDAIPFEVAAASMLRGLTAHMLLTLTYPVSAGSLVLIHAAAGGLGVLLTRWAKQLGARVIGTVGSEEKAALARAQGADHVIVGREADLAGAVAELTGGAGVDLVIDGIGGDMARTSLRCLRPFGVLACIGWVAGRVPPFELEELGTAMVAKPSVMAYAADPARYTRAAAAVIEAFRAGITAEVGGTYPLTAAAQAHGALEAGRTTGSLVLLP